MWLWDERDGLMEIFTNGIILNFIYTVGYCLVHRPYHRYRFNRYGLVFHTVTVTGYYLALVLCGVTVSLVVRYRKTGRWRDCWKQLSLLGMGNVYLFLTLSRTGYLAAYAMELFICVFVSCVWEKKKLAGMMKSLAAGIGVSLVFFPIVFTTQRILPAVFDDPVYSELEIWDYTIEKGESSDSQLYMDVEYFLRLAVYKLFDVEIPGQAQGIYRDGPGETLLAYRLENLDKPVYAAGISSALVSDTDMDSDYDLSNGRLEIFREYIGKWNLTGHDEMGFTFPDGSVSVHAHNTYLQVIHDHGLITGAVFLIFGIMSFGYALVHYCKRKEKQPYLLLTVAVITAFALAGMVEWIFHPCNPFGFAIFIVITPLLFETKGTQNKSLFPEKAE
jgi:hypothetical protein